MSHERDWRLPFGERDAQPWRTTMAPVQLSPRLQSAGSGESASAAHDCLLPTPRLSLGDALHAYNLRWPLAQKLVPNVCRSPVAQPHALVAPEEGAYEAALGRDRARFAWAAFGAQASFAIFGIQLAWDCFAPMGKTWLNPSGKPLPLLGVVALSAALPAMLVHGSMASNALAWAVYATCLPDEAWLHGHPLAARRGGAAIASAATLAALVGVTLWTVGRAIEHRAGWLDDASWRDARALAASGFVLNATVVPALSYFPGLSMGAAVGALLGAMGWQHDEAEAGVRLGDEPEQL